MKMAVFWAIALMMKAARTSETLVNFYQTTRCYNPEDSNLHTHRRENLKSYLKYRYVQTNSASLFGLPCSSLATLVTRKSIIILTTIIILLS
jgi:hypothetical protein